MTSAYRLKKHVLCLVLLLASWPIQARAAWTDADAGAILTVLDDAWTQGLDPEKYHVREIHALMNDPAQRGQRDRLLSDGAVLFGHDVSGPRLPLPKAAGWHAPIDDAALKIISESPVPARTLAMMAPQDAFYQALQQEMRRLAREKAVEAHWPTIDFGALPLKTGARHKDVAALRAQLGVTYRAVTGPVDYYDDDLAAAVMIFQRQHRLPADGVIDDATLRQLNSRATDRMAQVAVNLERLRWLDRTPPARYVLVNIPTQELWAVQGGRTVLTMPVVVGRRDRPTPSFEATITGIRFNPAWTVPPGIRTRDLLPQLRANPAALNGTGIEFIEGQGVAARTLAPDKIDWRHLSPAALAQIRMVQRPGANNALGRIRVLMPNDYDVYLHDTDAPELFGQADRADSSGCIRLSNPQAFANFVLAENPSWSDAKMKKILDAAGTTEIRAAKTMPVYIVYQTMWLDARGRLIYGPDPYGADKTLFAALGGATGTGISFSSTLAANP